GTKVHSTPQRSCHVRVKHSAHTKPRRSFKTGLATLSLESTVFSVRHFISITVEIVIANVHFQISIDHTVTIAHAISIQLSPPVGIRIAPNHSRPVQRPQKLGVLYDEQTTVSTLSRAKCLARSADNQ